MHLPPRSWLPAIVSLALLPCWSGAQLVPQRLYYGVDGRIEVEVRAPLSAPASQEQATPDRLGDSLEIQLVDPAGQVSETASVLPGPVDLAALFPSLWKGQTHQLQYAQLSRGQQRIGAPLVLQPMLTPMRATAADPLGQTMRFAPAAQETYTGLRAYIDKHVVLDTSLGEIRIALRPDVAPNTVWNFRHLVEGGFYTGVSFHRVVAGPSPDRGFVLQAGDPLGTGKGSPGYFIDLEKSTLPHDFGVVSMARIPQQPDSAGSQFFICLSRQRCRSLDGAYASFGQVVGGEEIVRAIARLPVAPDDRPVDPPLIRSAKLVDAPPLREKPATQPGEAPPAAEPDR
jgi:peptidyl-prolyl cis-trans isomerase B (cyclophilin B)